MSKGAPVPASAPDARARRRRRTRLEPQRFALLVGLVLVVGLFSALLPNTYATTANFTNMLGSQAVLLFLALALLTPLRAGDYDLSVASTLTLSGMTLSILNVNHGVPIGIAVLCALGVGLVIGAVNGAVVVLFEIDPFIVTLGVGTVVTGIVFWVSNSQTITGVSTGFSDLVVGSTIGGIPNSFFFALILCVVLWYVFDFTPAGQRLLFVGEGRDMARLNGLDVRRLRFGALTTSGFLGALAGVVYAATVGGSDPTSGSTFLLPAFAACFLGSTAFRIGRFNPWGTLVAVYFLIAGITGLQLFGAQNYVQQLFYGAALVLAVVLSRIVKARKARVPPEVVAADAADPQTAPGAPS